MLDKLKKICYNKYVKKLKKQTNKQQKGSVFIMMKLLTTTALTGIMSFGGIVTDCVNEQMFEQDSLRVEQGFVSDVTSDEVTIVTNDGNEWGICNAWYPVGAKIQVTFYDNETKEDITDDIITHIVEIGD